MNLRFSKLLRALVLSAAAGTFSVTMGLPLRNILIPSAQAADLSAAKAVVDAAKAQGIVGEQGDGYLGLVTGSANAQVTAAVNAINDGRKAVYRQTAAKSGVTPEAAAEAAGKLLLQRVPHGQFYKPLGGSWTKR